MKKLMFGAAIAATSMVFGASSQPAAQVYDVTLNIKSTAAATATKINNKANPLAVASATDTAIDIIYRKQASYTWKGLIWGCDCEAIDGVWDLVTPCDGVIKNYDTVKGCIIWDSKSKEVVFVGDESEYKYNDEDDALPDVSDVVDKGFGWDFLHCINRDGKTIEGVWTMTQRAPMCDKTAAVTRFDFTGAGFGTVAPVVLTDTYEDADGKKVTDYSWDCSSYIKKISGNFAGVMHMPSLTTKDTASGCAYCGGTYTKGNCDTAEDIWAWCADFGGTCGCDVDLFNDEEYTAAYGTWNVSYNSSVSKKLSTLIDVKKLDKTVVYSITQAYNFKNLPKVLAMIELIENEVIEQKGTPEEPSEECRDLETAMNAAYTAYTTANTLLGEYEDDVKFLSDKNAVEEAYNEAAEMERTAQDAKKAAQDGYDFTNDLYTAAQDAYNDAKDAETNLQWVVAYTNGGVEVAKSGVGSDKLSETINYYSDYACASITTNGAVAAYTWDDGKTVAKSFTDASNTAETKLTEAEGLLKKADSVLKAANENAERAAEAAELAKNTLENRTVLLAAAESKVASQKVIVSSCESDYEAKKAAYKAAGCAD